MVGASIHVAPLSSEYCSLVTATSSVAANVTFTGPRYHGLRRPVNAAGSSVATASVGAVVSAVCATAGAAGASTAATPASDRTPLENRLI